MTICSGTCPTNLIFNTLIDFRALTIKPLLVSICSTFQSWQSPSNRNFNTWTAHMIVIKSPTLLMDNICWTVSFINVTENISSAQIIIAYHGDMYVYILSQDFRGCHFKAKCFCFILEFKGPEWRCFVVWYVKDLFFCINLMMAISFKKQGPVTHAIAKCLSSYPGGASGDICKQINMLNMAISISLQ